MRILGLDLGKKRIGVAISDELGITAQALTTLDRGSFERDCAALREVVAVVWSGKDCRRPAAPHVRCPGAVG